MRAAKRSITLVVATFLLITSVFATSASGLSSEQKKLYDSGIRRFDAEAALCGPTETGGSISSDYAGNPILTEAQSAQIATNQSIYQQAATSVDIPWQMIAAIHLKEFGLKRENPSNGQGIYQFFNKQGGPYPTGPVDEAEFLRQTILAAQFIKNKAAANYQANNTLNSQSGPETIKDTFFSYNGRASVYSDQAASLGFDRDTQGYEGSPYVMNMADARRDPTVSPTTWGQIKHDNGSIEYPANRGYGAFIIYSALAGLQINCGAASGTFIWPEASSVTITSCFGPRVHPIHGNVRFHYGIDISGGSGTPILAVATGTVTLAGPLGGYGPNYVVIKHDNGYTSGYGHMSSMSVAEGDRVTQGQQIGTEGNEGASKGSHLHFNLIKGDYPGHDRLNINPLQNGLTVPAGVANPNNCS